MRRIEWYLLLVVGVICVGVGSAEAQVIAYDGFVYPVGPLTGDGPAFGFTAPWIADAGISVTSPGLSSPLDPGSIGNAVSGDFNYFSPLNTTLLNSEFWASFLLYNAGGNDQAYMGLTNTGLGSTIPTVAFGARLTQYGIFNNSSQFVAAPTPWSGVGATDFLLAHFQPSGASWLVSLYVNPTSLALPSVVTTVPLIPFNEVLNQNQVGFISDEVRIGDTAFDAGFVPEPECVAIGAIGVIFGMRQARRRKSND